MNKITIIGSLGKDPELKSTQAGIQVCSFNVAVNGKKGTEETTTWFRCTAWRGLADICGKYLSKGKKICVVGSVTLHEYKGNDGVNHASMEVNVDDVEFLSPKDALPAPTQHNQDVYAGFTPVDHGSELPF